MLLVVLKCKVNSSIFYNVFTCLLQTFPQSLGYPFPKYYGACGRMVVEEYVGKSLDHFFQEKWETRVSLLQSQNSKLRLTLWWHIYDLTVYTNICIYIEKQKDVDIFNIRVCNLSIYLWKKKNVIARADLALVGQDITGNDVHQQMRTFLSTWHCESLL